MFKQNVEFLFEPVVDGTEISVRIVVYERDLDTNERSIFDIIVAKSFTASLKRELMEITEYACFDKAIIVGDYDFGRTRLFKNKLERAFLETRLEASTIRANRMTISRLVASGGDYRG